MTRLILVRHGQSISNEKKMWGGQRDFPLTDLGKQQAETVANAIFKTERVDVIYSSDLSRAYCTGLAIAKHFALPVIKNEQLRELNTGRWTGKFFEDIKRTEPDLVEQRKSDPVHFAFPEGESFADLYERAKKAIQTIVEENEGRCVLIACHGGILRAFESFVRYRSIEHLAFVDPPNNTAISIYEYRDGCFSTVCYNRADHLISPSTNPSGSKELL